LSATLATSIELPSGAGVSESAAAAVVREAAGATCPAGKLTTSTSLPSVLNLTIVTSRDPEERM
jgi:hypothetical protein